MKKSQTGRAETGGAVRTSTTFIVAPCTVLSSHMAAAVQHVR